MEGDFAEDELVGGYEGDAMVVGGVEDGGLAQLVEKGFTHYLHCSHYLLYKNYVDPSVHSHSPPLKQILSNPPPPSHSSQ